MALSPAKRARLIRLEADYLLTRVMRRQRYTVDLREAVEGYLEKITDDARLEARERMHKVFVSPNKRVNGPKLRTFP